MLTPKSGRRFPRVRSSFHVLIVFSFGLASSLQMSKARKIKHGGADYKSALRNARLVTWMLFPQGSLAFA